jgi:hypothetical protein
MVIPCQLSSQFVAIKSRSPVHTLGFEAALADIASARRASGCEDHRTNNAELCHVSPLGGPLAPSAYFFRLQNPTRARNPANSVLIQSTFVLVRCPTATTLIEMKQLCGVANDLLAHRAIRGGKSRTAAR